MVPTPCFSITSNAVTSLFSLTFNACFQKKGNVTNLGPIGHLLKLLFLPYQIDLLLKFGPDTPNRQ